MITTWLKGLDDNAKRRMEEDFRASQGIRDKLQTILNDKIATSNKAVRNKELYTDASWAYRMADAVGYERALFEVISLISSDSVE